MCKKSIYAPYIVHRDGYGTSDLVAPTLCAGKSWTLTFVSSLNLVTLNVRRLPMKLFLDLLLRKCGSHHRSTEDRANKVKLGYMYFAPCVGTYHDVEDR